MPRDGEFGDAKWRLGALTDMWSRQQGRRWRGGRIAVRTCLVRRKFCKIFQISRHIESLDACMKY